MLTQEKLFKYLRYELDGQRHILGLFNTKEEAIQARKKAEQQLEGA